MLVSEAHRQLVEELFRLMDRLGLRAETDILPLPGEIRFLHLVPALHAIVDRLEKVEGRLDRMEAGNPDRPA